MKYGLWPEINHRIIGIYTEIRRKLDGCFLGLRKRKKSLGEIFFKMLLRKKSV